MRQITFLIIMVGLLASGAHALDYKTWQNLLKNVEKSGSVSQKIRIIEGTLKGGKMISAYQASAVLLKFSAMGTDRTKALQAMVDKISDGVMSRETLLGAFPTESQKVEARALLDQVKADKCLGDCP